MSDETTLRVQDSWFPPNGVNLHSGAPIQDVAEFFAEPPADIGEIVSAQTTLEVTTPDSMPTYLRIVQIVGLSSAVNFVAHWFIGYTFAWWIFPDHLPSVMLAHFIILMMLKPRPSLSKLLKTLALTGAACVLGKVIFIDLLNQWEHRRYLPQLTADIALLYLTRFRHTCTFVGTLGLAQVAISGSRKGTHQERKLLFAECHDVTTWRQDTYSRGNYLWTRYRFTWRNAAASPLFQVHGFCNSTRIDGAGSHRYQFAQAGESQWSEFALANLFQKYDRQGYIDFAVKHNDFVRVGNGFLEFHFGGDTTRLTQEDIKSLSIEAGKFYIHTHEARWFSRQGKFKFEYGGMGNAKLFVMCLERLGKFTVA